MSLFDRIFVWILCLLCFFQFGDQASTNKVSEQNRPYEFSFNIVDFQHRYEKKDENGLISGEYGFITADGVYHETGYATDKNGDFIITKMRNRKINSLKDAQEIFKDRPEAAKKLVEAVAKACGSCKIPIKQTKPEEPRKPANVTVTPLQKKMGPILEAMTKTLMDTKKTDGPRSTNKVSTENKEIISKPKDSSTDSKPKDERTKEVIENMVKSARKLLAKEEVPVASDGVLEKMANDLYYRFNYTITSHGHQEDGYRDGRKDGGYRAQSENGVDTQVKYLSNEFGHQPNITFVPRRNVTEEEHALKGYSFLWYWL